MGTLKEWQVALIKVLGKNGYTIAELGKTFEVHEETVRKIVKGYTWKGVLDPPYKIFLDDIREPPDKTWIKCQWPEEVIELLKTNEVGSISLDHDLGDDCRGTGYDVIKWIEEQVALHGYQPPSIIIHSANPSATQRMLTGVDSILRIFENGG